MRDAHYPPAEPPDIAIFDLSIWYLPACARTHLIADLYYRRQQDILLPSTINIPPERLAKKLRAASICTISTYISFMPDRHRQSYIMIRAGGRFCYRFKHVEMQGHITKGVFENIVYQGSMGDDTRGQSIFCRHSIWKILADLQLHHTHIITGIPR